MCGAVIRSLTNAWFCTQNHGYLANALIDAVSIHLSDYVTLVLLQFDKLVIVPMGGWKDVHDYRQQASSASYLSDVRVPLLCLNAEDDPIVSPKNWPLRVSEFSFLLLL